MTHLRTLVTTLIGLFILLPVAVCADISTSIRTEVERIRSGECASVADCPIASTIVLPALYEKYDYQPIWTNADSIRQLVAAIEASHLDGLNPEDYHLGEISRLQAELSSGGNSDTQASLDLVLTDSLVRLGYHLVIGKVDPESLDGNWNMERTLELDPILEMSRAIDSGNVSNLIDSFRPQAAVYHQLKSALARYRSLQAAGGWQAVPDGQTLKPGMNDPRVVALRRRLAVTGDMPAANDESPEFDEQLEAGVRRFQARHGLEADGVVGKGTLAELNVPVEARIDQLRVNLERARWVLNDLPQDFVITDIAGFRVMYFRGGELFWESRAQVGKSYRKTPVFRDSIRYVEFNPTWTVPPTILKKDILPKVKKDPGYLREKNIRVIDRNGKTVDAGGIDWSRYPAAGFPYMLRQDPGPKNALGRVKFMFPNKHAVYLHDTPHKSGFARAQRTFSSGCIRVEDPFAFARLLLDDKPDWDQSRIDGTLESLKTTRVNLTEPLTVMLLYWTAVVDNDGRVIFRKDVYDRDAAVLSALNAGFSFRQKPVIRQQQ
jgi:murein L,D-transpeptidase YcbB/YkuD